MLHMTRFLTARITRLVDSGLSRRNYMYASNCIYFSAAGIHNIYILCIVLRVLVDNIIVIMTLLLTRFYSIFHGKYVDVGTSVLS